MNDESMPQSPDVLPLKQHTLESPLLDSDTIDQLKAALYGLVDVLRTFAESTYTIEEVVKHFED